MLLWLADKETHWLLSPRVPRPIEKSAEFEMDVGRRLCAGAACK